MKRPKQNKLLYFDDMLEALKQALPFLIDLAQASDDESHYQADVIKFKRDVEALIAKAKGDK